MQQDNEQGKGAGIPVGRSPEDCLFNGKYEFKLSNNINRSVCDLKVFYQPNSDQVIVLVSELPNNPGVSICNAFEALFKMICNQFELIPQHIIWIEHWRKWSEQEGGYSRDIEEYALVEYELKNNAAIHPDWKHLAPEKLDEILTNKV